MITKSVHPDGGSFMYNQHAPRYFAEHCNNVPVLMTLLSNLRYLRHGPLRFLAPVWILLGRFYRRATAIIGIDIVESHFIGPYGPFRMAGEFAFSDFASWGQEHNSGFARCVEACRNHNCVFDIGAHIGLVTMPMSRTVAPEGHVYAFEPASANRSFLAHHLRLNNITNVTVIDLLVGDTKSEAVPFFEHRAASGMNTRAPVKDQQAYVETNRAQTTLDAFCRENDLAPDVIKIDVEGAELTVLEGARQVLSTCRPFLVISMHPHHLKAMGRDPGELHQFAETLNYRVTDTAGNRVEEFQLDEYIMAPNES